MYLFQSKFLDKQLVLWIVFTHLNFNNLYIGSSTLGENFNPANDCSDIVDNIPGAIDGFYWIKSAKGKLLKVILIMNIQ